MTEGGAIIAEGMGTPTIPTEGYGYAPLVEGILKPIVQQYMNNHHLMKIKNDVGTAFAALRSLIGEQATLEAILAAIDETILQQQGVYNAKLLEGLEPDRLAEIGYAQKEAK